MLDRERECLIEQATHETVFGLTPKGRNELKQHCLKFVLAIEQAQNGDLVWARRDQQLHIRTDSEKVMIV